jgi:hypothetical protein
MCCAALRRYNVLVVHAALLPGVPIEAQDLGVCTKVRDLLHTPDGRYGQTSPLCCLCPAPLTPSTRVMLYTIVMCVLKETRAVFLVCGSQAFITEVHGSFLVLVEHGFVRRFAWLCVACCRWMGFEQPEEGTQPWAECWQGGDLDLTQA